MSPFLPRSRRAASAAHPGHPPPGATLDALLRARRSGRESSTAVLPAPGRQTSAPVAALPPELDATRAAPPRRQQDDADATVTPATPPAHRVLLPDGTAVALSRPALAGRAPSPHGDTDALVVVDPTRSVSRAHARLEPSVHGIVVVDLGSANGTTVRGRDGSVHDAGDGTPCVAGPGSTIHLGDVALTVTDPPPPRRA